MTWLSATTRPGFLCLLAGTLLCHGARMFGASPPPIAAFVESYCLDCHDADAQKGGINLEGLGFELTDAAKAQLASEGWDPAYGARPLKRAIQQRIENPLASRILAGEFGAGDTVRVDVQGTTFVFTKTEVAVPSAGS